MAQGDFFAIGRPQWEAACKQGVRHAAVILVMACGTQRDNVTTSWSADAAFRYAGVNWHKARDAIGDLIKLGVVERLKDGKRPRYAIGRPDDDDDLIWLPNTLVTAAGKEKAPIRRLREAQDVDFMQAFVELYGLHDLPGDGGLPRSLIRSPFLKAEHICDRGLYRIYGFMEAEERVCSYSGPLARFRGQRGAERNRVWDFIYAVEEMGLLERVDYLTESDAADAELIHAVSGDDHGKAVAMAASFALEALPDGHRHAAEKFTYALPVERHMCNVAVVGVYRLVYRPHTARTTAWYSNHAAACEAKANEYLRFGGA
ncbi:hypothetical protein LK996_01190 [Lysobacter sp. A6]|uniref:Uncharacterized protein n=1 Tax=Noviluteimonas lactosilytica TaxID=2888523 RepID=A0ABS8JDM5_9GAMM|nr:hypothetical protein [Lysobacter lactosilyticus]MCC8361699.1 hypothetical protein [Lysobacter lactosilyticus]